MDGSSAPFVYLIQEAGLRTLATPRRVPEGAAPRSLLSRGDKLISLYPSALLQGHLQHQLRSPAAAPSVAHAAVERERVIDDIAARATFGFLHEVELLRQQGSRWEGPGERDRVERDRGAEQPAPVRRRVPWRHKILDAIGICPWWAIRSSAPGGPPGGHALHTAFAKRILEEPDAWKLVELVPEQAAAFVPAAVPVKAG